MDAATPQTVDTILAEINSTLDTAASSNSRITKDTLFRVLEMLSGAIEASNVSGTITVGNIDDVPESAAIGDANFDLDTGSFAVKEETGWVEKYNFKTVRDDLAVVSGQVQVTHDQAAAAAEAAEGVQQALVLYLPLAGGKLTGDVEIGEGGALISTDLGPTLADNTSLRILTSRNSAAPHVDLEQSVSIGVPSAAPVKGDASLVPAPVMRWSASVRPGLMLALGIPPTSPGYVVNSGDEFTGPWRIGHTYIAEGTELVFDGNPLAGTQSLYPTRDDHVITGKGLRLYQYPVKNKRVRVVEFGSGALANTYGTAVGDSAFATGERSTAVGSRAKANVEDAIAIGADAVADSADVVQIGKPGTHQKIRVGSNELVNLTELRAIIKSATDFDTLRAKIDEL